MIFQNPRAALNPIRAVGRQIADEPTTGLDVTTQAVVMDLIKAMAAQTGMATILITHDLALAAERADRIAVMHAGHMVEAADTATLLARPMHPYTARLIAATPTAAGSLDALQSVPGGLPDLRASPIPNCRYSARCERKLGACAQVVAMREQAPGHLVACWNPLGLAA